MSQIEIKQDNRGSLAELFREEISPGQVYMFTIEPFHSRGGHWHERKTERFILIEGTVALLLEDMKTGTKKQTILKVMDNAFTKIEVPTDTRHTFSNSTGERATVIAYIDEKFNPEDTDTFY